MSGKKNRKTGVSLLAGLALMAGFAAASVWSARRGYADYLSRQSTPESAGRAIRLMPGDAEYYGRLALLDPAADGARLLEQAVALNPSNGGGWIDLGLRYEAAGNAAQAERCLRRAAEEDRTYLPRWTLANYYFRRNDMAKFWVWAGESAGMLSGDAEALLRLCGQAGEDGRLMEKLKVDRPELRASYLSYLIRHNRPDLIGIPGTRLLENVRDADVPVLLAACDRLLEAGNVAEAVNLWDGLAEARKIPFARADREKAGLTNAGFSTPPTSRGLDWRLPQLYGVSTASEENSGGLRLTFSGREPELCDPLVQVAPVAGNREYQVAIGYRTSGIAAGAGLRWRVALTNGAVLKESGDLSSEASGRQTMSFRTPPGCRLVRLSLHYERAAGATRIEGFLILRKVELGPVRK